MNPPAYCQGRGKWLAQGRGAAGPAFKEMGRVWHRIEHLLTLFFADNALARKVPC
jgi:hypothetical protein